MRPLIAVIHHANSEKINARCNWVQQNPTPKSHLDFLDDIQYRIASDARQHATDALKNLCITDINDASLVVPCPHVLRVEVPGGAFEIEGPARVNLLHLAGLTVHDICDIRHRDRGVKTTITYEIDHEGRLGEGSKNVRDYNI